MSRLGSKKEEKGPGMIKDKEKIIAIKTSLDESNAGVSDSETTELFNFWRQMHGPGGSVCMVKEGTTLIQPEMTGNVVVSRKRKAWEGVHTGGNKYVGSGRLPPARGLDDEEGTNGLETPNCSNTGFEDEVGEGSGGEQEPSSSKNQIILSPINPNLLNVEDIDADNLAADFDGSFTGLGVDINTANYSMSELNIAINAQHLKQEGNRPSPSKPEHQYIFSNYGALDLSNDEAQHPDHTEDTPPPQGPPTFSGSVSRDNSQDSIIAKIIERKSSHPNAADLACKTKLETQSPVHQYDVERGGAKGVVVYGKGGTKDLICADDGFPLPKLEHFSNLQTSDEDSDERFQYILNAPTSIATKVGEPSLTYINQGQSYELKIKKLGDLSSHYKKKWLRTTIRICFHERRLQYIESEQIAEWARTHPNERILEIDMPLSYGIAEVKQDPSNLSNVTFSWDPTRETGVFVKVHCISTEFTPKKHGGERGVPFRLQVETWSSEARINAAACILQVFKLKGADRKHKQDREKVMKRTKVEQDKFSPQYECTVLSDLSVDSIYIPPSRTISPLQSDSECSGPTAMVKVQQPPPPPQQQQKSSSVPPPSTAAREETSFVAPTSWLPKPSPTNDSKSWKGVLSSNASVETTSGWLSFHRYGLHVKSFQNYDARDLLRLGKDDLVQMIGILDGIRLYNDLHMKPVAPRLTLYIAQNQDTLYHPILLEEVTVTELIRLIADAFEIPEALLTNMTIFGPNKILVRMTDEYLRYQAPNSAFKFSIIFDDNGDSCTLHLEPALFHL